MSEAFGVPELPMRMYRWSRDVPESLYQVSGSWYWSRLSDGDGVTMKVPEFPDESNVAVGFRIFRRGSVR